MPTVAQNVVIRSASFDMPVRVVVPQRPASAPAGAADPARNGAARNGGDGGANGGAPDPSPGSGLLPGLIVLHDLYGPDEATHQAAERLAESGYATVVPDLFARSGGPHDKSSEAALLDFTTTLTDSRIIGDVVTVVGWLSGQEGVDAGRLGVLGWGWGGAYALMAAAHDSRLRVVADIGGHITYPVLTARQPGSPLNFLASIEGVFFGAFADKDPWLPLSEVERLREQLIDHDKRGEIKIYPDTPARFWRNVSLPQTGFLWRRLENFLHQNLAEPRLSDEPLGEYPNEESRLHA